MFCAQFDTNLASTHEIIVNSAECLSIANYTHNKSNDSLKEALNYFENHSSILNIKKSLLLEKLILVKLLNLSRLQYKESLPKY